MRILCAINAPEAIKKILDCLGSHVETAAQYPPRYWGSLATSNLCFLIGQQARTA